MTKPADQCETPIELNNIRTALNKITDTELALDILTNIENLTTFTNKQNDALKAAKDEVSRIQGINQALMIRATATNSTLPPTTTTGYSDIDPVQSIIDRI